MLFAPSAHPRAVLLRSAGAFAAAASLLVACGGGGKAYTGAQARAAFDGPLSVRDKADIAAMQARVHEKLASGYAFRAVGTVSSATVSRDGSSTVRLNRAGDHVRLSLVPQNEAQDHIVINAYPGRTTMGGNPPACGGCDTGGTGSTPPPVTAPPNYGPCSAAGGATWYNSYNGAGGCLGPGSNRDLSCGTWNYLSAGRGRLLYGNNQHIDAPWVIDNGDGTCDFGS